ncbi:hypothetical protein K3495_g2989 [Podosphaera aphanis]|nr:hypothetical protein K3495_g2989 [Podosphaera aphanis]
MSFFSDIKSSLHDFTEDLKKPIHDIRNKIEQKANFCLQDNEGDLHNNRHRSFAPKREHNNAKWFVDGCGYMWAVSVAIMEARESIWILDWWLSPELYLRRPPSENEDYRLDRMLLAAAERGVKVNIIVYKEVTAFLTINSSHTKSILEAHPNIAVFRHPDHKPTGQVVSSEIEENLGNFSLSPLKLITLPGDSLKAFYGAHEDVVLYWAHHEKLCLIDGKTAFMGGLDLCFGRWDTNDHPISDAHPTDPKKILFPGQDFNNARIYDFENLSEPMKNKLDRSEYSRMGWSDVAICLTGAVADDLKAHFVQRWNFIYNEKYSARKDPRYTALRFTPDHIPHDQYLSNGDNVLSTGRNLDVGEDNDTSRAVPTLQERTSHLDFHSGGEIFNKIRSNFPVSRKNFVPENQDQSTSIAVQLVRSCTKWSHGVCTEHSISNAYIDTIKQSQHFIYIENQFFITATGDNQRPVRNKIGAAIVERVVRAFREGQKFKVIIVIPAVPAFAGDLKAEDSLGTRAIMEFQHHSICRNGHSIIEKIEQAGVPDAREYIRFYHLRNFDRISAGDARNYSEQQSSMICKGSRMEQYGNTCTTDCNNQDQRTNAYMGQNNHQYNCYQQPSGQMTDQSNFDSISSCYMDSSIPVTQIPWSGSPEAEMQAFVSEELYIHSKLLISDDRVVICGSANLNDRSQLGYHDSEIAVVIEDSNLIQTSMNGRPYQASAFASSLRRQLFRKHLGLLPPQDPRHATMNFLPVTKAPNEYDWNSPADRLVSDPLADDFIELWNRTACINTEVFSKAFHIVPSDNCRNWREYDEWYGKFFLSQSKKGDREQIPPKYKYGHLVEEEFPGGVQEAKEWLSRIRGTLIEMPLKFMEEVDFAVAGIKFNALTMEIYT